MEKKLAFVLGLLGLTPRHIDVPAFEEYPLPPKMYSPEADSSRTVVDVSFKEDALDWKKYEFEFSEQPRLPLLMVEGQGRGEIIKVDLPSGAEYECEMPSAEVEESMTWKSEAFDRKAQAWLRALKPLRNKVLIHVPNGFPL